IGECNPCDAVVTNVVGRYSAVGYSGTNAGGNLEIRDSVWEFNGTAIMPNSFFGLAVEPPQRSSLIIGNVIRDSGTVPVPANSPLAGFIGMGIAIAGGWENVVQENTISRSDRYGIALFPTAQQGGSSIQPTGNTIRDNVVGDSGIADLALATVNDSHNCFELNQFGTSLPANIETGFPCEQAARSEGDPTVLADLGRPAGVLLAELGSRPAYTQMPVPGPQTTMPTGGSVEPTPLATDGQSPLLLPTPTATTTSSESATLTPKPVASAGGDADPSTQPSPVAWPVAAVAVGLVFAAALVLLVLRRSRAPKPRGRPPWRED
ncbi:MAG: right-handed parallel beta-helix repeat-containing protein, partial [Candidatus Limnocylindrales bacterium]